MLVLKCPCLWNNPRFTQQKDPKNNSTSTSRNELRLKLNSRKTEELQLGLFRRKARKIRCASLTPLSSRVTTVTTGLLSMNKQLLNRCILKGNSRKPRQLNSKAKV
jgi:hypothetical protein